MARIRWSKRRVVEENYKGAEVEDEGGENRASKKTKEVTITVPENKIVDVTGCQRETQALKKKKEKENPPISDTMAVATKSTVVEDVVSQRETHALKKKKMETAPIDKNRDEVTITEANDVDDTGSQREIRASRKKETAPIDENRDEATVTEANDVDNAGSQRDTHASRKKKETAPKQDVVGSQIKTRASKKRKETCTESEVIGKPRASKKKKKSESTKTAMNKKSKSKQKSRDESREENKEKKENSDEDDVADHVEDETERFDFEVEDEVGRFVDELPTGRREIADSSDEDEDSLMVKERRIRRRSEDKLGVGKEFFFGGEFKEAVLEYCLSTGYYIRQGVYFR